MCPGRYIVFNIRPPPNIIQGSPDTLPNAVSNYSTVQSDTPPMENNASTTYFADDSGVVAAEQPLPQTLASAYTKQSAILVTSDVAGFLSKPKVIQSGSFTPSDNPSTFAPILIPNEPLLDPIYLDKLRGYFGFRATTVLTLQVNAERFQQGRYKLTFCPTGGESVSTNFQMWIDSHSCSLVQRSLLPGVEVDLNCDTSGQVRIPFSSTLDFFPFRSLFSTEKIGNWGVARIFPYRYLEAVAGSLSCDYTLWCHFEDIELIGPAAPQDTVVFQSRAITKKVTKKNPSAAEAESMDVGPIQSIALKVSKAAKFLNAVPILNDFTAPLGWAADIVGNVASVFGWSAPINMSPVCRMITSEMTFATNFNKVDNSYPLSIDLTNQVEVMPGFGGTNEDELDFISFTSHSTYATFFQMTNVQARDTILFQTDVWPGALVNSYVNKGYTNYNYSPLQYMCEKFSYWRGDITYKLKIVKTEFHSGRIAINFTPYDEYNGAIFINSGQEPYLLREIVDIREMNEYTFTVPFISTTPYKPTSGDCKVGWLDIRVLDKLVAPDNVKPDISFIVEISGAPNMEFNGFRNVALTPADDIVYQSRPIDKSDCAMVSKMIGNASAGQFQLETSKAAIGERLLSFRSLLKRFYAFSGPYFGPTPLRYSEVLPFAVNYTDSTAEAYAAPLTCDLLGELCTMFCYSRGGVRLKIKTPENITKMSCFMEFNPGDNLGQVTMVTPRNNTIRGYDTALNNFYSRNTYVSAITRDNSMEVQIPQYSMTHSRANASLGVSVTTPYYMRTKSLSPKYTLVLTEDIENPLDRTPIDIRLLRSAADDFNLSEFISIPPMIKIYQ